jgi:hypothetical protein
MPDDEDDAVAYQLVCCGDRLIRVAEVVAHEELDLLAEEAALAIEIRGRHPSTAFELLAEPRLRAAHWTSHPNPDFGRRGPCAEWRQDDCRSKNDGSSAHRVASHGHGQHGSFPGSGNGEPHRRQRCSRARALARAKLH